MLSYAALVSCFIFHVLRGVALDCLQLAIVGRAIMFGAESLGRVFEPHISQPMGNVGHPSEHLEYRELIAA